MKYNEMKTVLLNDRIKQEVLAPISAMVPRLEVEVEQIVGKDEWAIAVLATEKTNNFFSGAIVYDGQIPDNPEQIEELVTKFFDEYIDRINQAARIMACPQLACGDIFKSSEDPTTILTIALGLIVNHNPELDANTFEEVLHILPTCVVNTISKLKYKEYKTTNVVEMTIDGHNVRFAVTDVKEFTEYVRQTVFQIEGYLNDDDPDEEIEFTLAEHDEFTHLLRYIMEANIPNEVEKLDIRGRVSIVRTGLRLIK